MSTLVGALGSVPDSQGMPARAIVAAVIVTFRPDPATLKLLVDRLLNRVAMIVFADNGSDGVVAEIVRALSVGTCLHLDFGENRGVGAGLNRGIEAAFANGAEYVLLSDQDSLPAENMIVELMLAHRALKAAGHRIAAVGPQYFDGRSGHVSPFVATRGLRLQQVVPITPDAPVEVDFLISSGSLISTESWKVVGPLHEPMFIDYVDIAWGLSASSRGLTCYGIATARLEHALGDRRMSFLGRSVPIHSPLRHYYQVRNPLWLYRQPWVPLNWKIVDLARLVMRIAFNAVFVAPRGTNIRYMARGLFDGLVGRMGRHE